MLTTLQSPLNKKKKSVQKEHLIVKALSELDLNCDQADVYIYNLSELHIYNLQRKD